MKYETATILIAFFGLATAAPTPQPQSSKNVFSIPRAMLRTREVPQEHSHNRFLDGVRVNLNLNNPAKIQDPVFGLLGDGAAAAGAGSITNLACLHQATADQAFTNAKAAKNITGQSDALLYAALERNTGKVGLASAACTETAVNPEINAVKQHQDPASPNAAAVNKAIVLELAKQLASIGADPQEALLSGTFKPGVIGDPTARGNACDTEDDVEGCIFSQNLLVDDATAAEITAAVAGIKKGSAVAASDASSSDASSSDASSSDASSSDASSSDASSSDASSSDASSSDASSSSASSSDASSSSASSSDASSSDASSSSASSSDSSSSCPAPAPAPATAAKSSPPAAALDFGTCSDPSIDFKNGLDGRTEPAFIPNDLSQFNHGSALNIGVISGFICGQLPSACKAGAEAVAACAKAESAASGLTGQAAADAFNSALGVGGKSASSADAAGEKDSSSEQAAASTAGSAATSTPEASSSATSSNVQTFTGTLGGAAPPVVESTGDRPFSVNGNTFVNKAAALQRSCSIQNTNCSNAANAGSLPGTNVADCNAQEDACNAA